MSVTDAIDVSTEVWGGLVTNEAPADLPHGVSPDCQDTQFQIGSVKTRPGVIALYTLAGSALLQYLKTYETLNETPRFLSLDSLGILRKDVTPGGALTPIYSGIIPGAYGKSISLFGREYFAFGNGTNGLDMPRQYDDTNFDRLSQVGPGAPPEVHDNNVTFQIGNAAGKGIDQFAGLVSSASSEAGNTVTLTFASLPAYGAQQLVAIGDSFNYAGDAVGGYNGTWVITAINYGNNTIQYFNPTSGLAASAGGTATFGVVTVTVRVSPTAAGAPYGFTAGSTATIAAATVAAYNVSGNVRGTKSVVNVPTWLGVAVYNVAFIGLANDDSGTGTIAPIGTINAGVHKVAVAFITRSGFYTKPSPYYSWTAAGSLQAYVDQIPTGPPNVVARVIMFTAANQSGFYHLGPMGLTGGMSSMIIPDNTTTKIVLNFSDQVLLATEESDDALFDQVELPPVSGITQYSSRLAAWGEQSNLQSFQNLTFDGGFNGNVPSGWTQDPTNFAGGSSAVAGALPVVFGDAFAITGDGATAIRGKITQQAATNYLGNPILSPNVAYTVQCRIRQTGVAQGTAHINLQSTIGGYTTAGLSVAFGAATGTYALFSASLTAALGTIPSDLMLQVYADGTPTNNGIFTIDNIEIYPTNPQFNNSTLRLSKGQLDTQGQESFDSETGLIEYNVNDGQSIRTCFKIRSRLYIVKEHSMGVTQDDGVNEPSLWGVEDVTKEVGTPSVNGVGIGEDWAVIAHRTGFYIFWGGEVLKISQEIQEVWDTINWQYGYTISVTVDTRKRRIYVCAPFGNSTTPNKTLVLDYHDVGSSPSDIASNAPIHLTYTGTKKAFDRSRKWCPWTIPANSVAMIELSNGKMGAYFGSNDGTGHINVLDDTATIYTDNGAQIPYYYVTAAFAELPTEEAKQLRSHRHLYTYLTMYIQGSGTIGLTCYPSSLSNAIALNSQSLSNPSFKDTEIGLNQSTERLFFKVSSGGVGQWADLQRFCVSMKQEPWSIVRGS